VALAFANTDTAGRPANVKLTVYSDSGTQAATRTLDALQPLEHLPTFLYQLFPGVTLTRGYVDIQSDVPVSGTALTFVQSQFSSLPLNPSFGIYNMNTTVSGIPTRGQLTLWKEGVFINGILRVIEVAGTPIPPEVYLAHGELSEGKLKLLLNVKGQSTFGFEILAMATSSLPFDFSQTQFEGSYLASFVGQSQTQTGTFYAERVR